MPDLRFIVQFAGSTTVNVIEFEQLQPDPVAVIVTLPADSPAVNVTEACVPDAGLKVPSPLFDHVAGFPVTVRVTSSPTPIFVRALLAGDVAVV